MLSCPSKEYSLRGTAVFIPSLFQLIFLLHTLPSPSLYLHCPFILPSLLSHQDGSRAGRERKKTVSFSSSLSEKKISSAADCIHSMVGQELQCNPLNKTHLHGKFNVQSMHQGFVKPVVSSVELVQMWSGLSSVTGWQPYTNVTWQVEGSELKKIRTNSRVYQRYYLLDPGLQALCWEPSKKESDKARISLDSIREVRRQSSLNQLWITLFIYI